MCQSANVGQRFLQSKIPVSQAVCSVFWINWREHRVIQFFWHCCRNTWGSSPEELLPTEAKPYQRLRVCPQQTPSWLSPAEQDPSIFTAHTAHLGGCYHLKHYPIHQNNHHVCLHLQLLLKKKSYLELRLRSVCKGHGKWEMWEQVPSRKFPLKWQKMLVLAEHACNSSIGLGGCSGRYNMNLRPA